MSEAEGRPAKRQRVTFGDTETRTYAPTRSSADPRPPRVDDAEDVHRARGGRRGGTQRAAAAARSGSGSAEGDEYDESVVALVLMRVVQDVEIQAGADKLYDDALALRLLAPHLHPVRSDAEEVAWWLRRMPALLQEARALQATSSPFLLPSLPSRPGTVLD